MQNLKVGDLVACRIYTKGLNEDVMFDGEVVTGRVFEAVTEDDPAIFIENCKIETSDRTKQAYFNRYFKDELQVHSKLDYESELQRGIVGEFVVFEKLLTEDAKPEVREVFTAGEKVWCPFLCTAPLELEDAGGTGGFLKAKGYSQVFDCYGSLNAYGVPMLFKITAENHSRLLETFGVDMQGLVDWESICTMESNNILRGYVGMVLLTSEPCELDEDGNVVDIQKALWNGAILMSATTWMASTKFNNYRFVLKVQM